ncbi:GNAT family N-acetyltransferase [Aminipila sp.]|uniref:GNAT family N-acetyltransferase n=1 Tax=Aminipila sp. TaxID=2060095 RepID=UPI0028982375|nr:GNAT family N-acetyltransferase [Aminipila sp.]
MNIRLANMDDCRTISKINYDNWRETYKGILSDEFLDHLDIEQMRNEYVEFLSDHKKQILVALDEKDEILGFASFEPDSKEDNCIYLASLHVDVRARGKGIGTSLLIKVGQYGLNNHYSNMSICILQGNVNAKNLYVKLGAEHYKDFEDNFHGIKTKSEKLFWKDLTIFKNDF